jgi:hypothetical protein
MIISGRLFCAQLLMLAASFVAVAAIATSEGAPTPRQEVKLLESNGAANDSFGYAVAISGNTAIVRLVGGRADIFVRKGDQWELQQQLMAPQGYSAAVAISGNTALVEAAHSVYVFVREGTKWTQQAILTASGASSTFGYSIAVSGDTAVVGDAFQDRDGRHGAGAVYIFDRTGGTWSPGQALPINDRKPDPGRGDFFGASVGISGDTVIVGAPVDEPDGDSVFIKGSAYIYVRNNGVWTEQKWLTVAGTSELGTSVAISGDKAIAGSKGYQAFIFERSGTTWSAPGELSPAAGEVKGGERYGETVAISGDFAIVGADADYGFDVPNRGAAYLFQRSGGAWSEIQKLQGSDVDPNSAQRERFGLSVAVSGETAIVGAPNKKVGANVDQGEAYIYQVADADGDGLPDEWEKKGITINNAGEISIGNTGNGYFLDLPQMGANPMHKDIFIHVDWLGPDPSVPDSDFKPTPRAIQLVVDAFAIAPLSNPDGKDGATLHVDYGPDSIMKPATGTTWSLLSRAGELPYKAPIEPTAADFPYTNWPEIDAYKHSYFGPAKRAGVFHYALYCDTYSRGAVNGGISRGFGTTDFLVACGGGRIRVATSVIEASVFMHELGHNLGLHHGGDDDVNYKPNYVSIMNYRFEGTGLLFSGGQRAMDYSRATLDKLDETQLNESVGINDPAGHLTTWNRYTRPSPNQCTEHEDTYFRLFYPDDALDWDCNGAVTPASPKVEADLNSDGRCVSAPADGTLHSAPGGDDVVIGPFITAGPNRTCETTAKGGDIELREVGFVEPKLLNGYNDWPALDFTGGGAIGTFGSVPDSRVQPLTESTGTGPLLVELTIEELLAEVPPTLVAEETTAPLDIVSISGQAGSFVINFDGSGSTAMNGTIVKWEWKFGDGTTGTGATVTHTYSAAGDYFVTLTVTDSNGRVNLIPLLNRVTVPYKPHPTPTPTPPPTPTPTPSKANLTPYKPTGWADTIVVSKATGTHTDSSPLLPTDKLYVDFAVINNGGTAITTSFKNKLLVDDVAVGTFTTNPPLNPTGFYYVEDFPVGPLPAGQHSVKLVADANAEIVEANQDDNVYARVVSVAPTPRPISQTYTVKNTNDSGPDSLRQALLDANSHPNGSSGIDRIAFSIPGGGVKTITPSTTLPSITDTVLIDGYTQPGASANTLAVGDNAVLLVELNMGTIAGSIGLDLRAGGTTVRGLVINRYGANALRMFSGDNNTIEGCFIGTNAAGTAAATQTVAANRFPSNPAIALYQGSGTRIGGTTPGVRNVIVGGAIGIGIGNDAYNGIANTLIQGNYIGTNAAGTAALNNQRPVGSQDISGSGIYAAGAKITNTTIGGIQPGAGNLISGNGAPGDDGLGVRGIVISGAGSSAPIGDVTIQGNLIGVNATGTAAIPNSNGGIFVTQSVSHLVIGGATAAARNVISGNGTGLQSFGLDDIYIPAGVKIYADTTNGISVQGNYIGLGSDGVTLIPNRINGIEIRPVVGRSYTIGGTNPGEGNVIAGTARINGLLGHGVQVVRDTFVESNGSVAILGNSIFANEGLGIDLLGYPENAFSVTRNDPGDVDTGANNLQNYPVLGSVWFAGGNVTIEGTLNSVANTTYRVEFFASKAFDPSRFGQGEFFLGFLPVTTDVNGNVAFKVSFPVPAETESASATATDPNGNTSEFSAAPGQLLNISTRLRVQTGDNALIGGFIVTGTLPKKVIIRAIGPSLDIPGDLADPTLELHDATGAIIEMNDNWKSDQEQEIVATTVPPTNDLESAIVRTLNPGTYTAIVRGKNETTGIGLVEAYDLNATPGSKVANISTRGYVESGDNVLIGGFIVGPDGGWQINGPGDAPINTKVIVRAIGPSLPVLGKLANPTLELRSLYGDVIATNDNWRTDQQAEIIATTIPPSNDLESAIVRTLPPGNYTAIVRGANGEPGVALVEVFNLP